LKITALIYLGVMLNSLCGGVWGKDSVSAISKLVLKEIDQIPTNPANAGLRRDLELFLKEPSNVYRCIPAMEQAYNFGYRDLAIKILEVGLSSGCQTDQVIEARLALYRYEHDLEGIVNFYLDALETRIAGKSHYWPVEIIDTPAIRDRILPVLVERYHRIPENPILFGFLRELYYKMQRKEELAKLYEVHLKAAPGDILSIYAYCNLLLETKQYERLLTCAATTLSASNVEVQLPEGMPQRSAQTKQTVGIAAQEDSSVHWWYLQGLLGTGRTNEALTYAGTTANRFRPEMLVEFYMAAGLTNRALELAHSRLESNDYRTAELLSRLGDREGVVRAVEGTIARRDHQCPNGYAAWVVFQCEDYCLRVGETNEAEKAFSAGEKKFLEDMAKNDHPSINYPYEIWYRYFSEGKQERFAEALLPILKGKPDEIVSILHLAAESLIETNQAQRAIDLLQRHRVENAENYRYLFILGQTLQKAGRFDEALRVYKVAEKHQPATNADDYSDSFSNSDLLTAQYSCYMTQKQYRVCEVWLQDKMSKATNEQQYPNKRVLQNLLGVLYETEGATAKAVEAYRGFSDHHRIIQLYLRVGQTNDATSYIRSLPDAKLRESLSEGYDVLRPDRKRQIELARQKLQLNSREPSAHAALGLLLIQDGDLEKGRGELRQAIQMGHDFGLRDTFKARSSCFPTFSRTPQPHLYQVVPAYFDREKLKECEADFEPLLSKNLRAHVNLLETIARLHIEHHDVSAAVRVYRRLMELDLYNATYYADRVRELTEDAVSHTAN